MQYKLKNENQKNERGASLIALMALMTIMAIFMLAAAPIVQQQQQRNLEEEAIHRGEEVAEAIRLYVRFNRGVLPTSMDQLLEGVNIPGRTKKLQILRASAAHDPLSSSGEWKLIRPNAKEFITFARDVTEYNNNVMPQTTEPLLQQYVQFVVNTRNTDEDEEEEAPGGEDDFESGTGPFIGVVSRSQRKSVITYYGIERHDRWIFTPLLR
jgi:type II secretory pathway pseudopilin PulG